MSFRAKIILLTFLPLLLAIGVIAAFSIFQTKQLGNAHTQAFADGLMETRKSELINYAQLGFSAIKALYESDTLTLTQRQSAAIDILKALEFGEDGYFFIYDYQGKNLGHARKPELEGQNLYSLQDARGNYLIQALISKARQGGGFTEYLWDKPSIGRAAEKLSYSFGLDNWHWMIGTGLYIDDIQRGVNKLNAQVAKTAKQTFKVTAMITIAALSLIALLGLFINMSESNLANSRLKALTQKSLLLQEDERRRVSRELHDGINQLLVSVRYKLEQLQYLLTQNKKTKQNKPALNIIQNADDVLSSSINEVRRISKDLRPTMLDDLGLCSAIDSLCNDFSQRTGIIIHLEDGKSNLRLPIEIETTLYRIIQEALNNIEKHAISADKIQLAILQKETSVILTIRDNGQGFDPKILDDTELNHSSAGLQNMQDRAELLNGKIAYYPQKGKGMRIKVTIPFKRQHLE